jgi:Raf kinase inhibitor-like YbhB/YbcL family protein
MAPLELHSPSFNDHGMIPPRHAKNAGNRSPAISWGELPEETVELALICEDPKAHGGRAVHWVMAGIDPSMHELPEAALPDGAVPGRNSFGDIGYDGPMPRAGDPPHSYFFHLYAAREPLAFHEGDTAEELRAELRHKELASGLLVGTYPS